MSATLMTDGKTSPFEPKWLRFTGPKVPRHIPYVWRWHLEALIQAALTTDIALLLPVDGIDQPDIAQCFAFEVEHKNGMRFRILVLDEGATAPEGTDWIIWQKRDLLKEPRRTNARTLWSSKSIIASTGDRLRVLRALDSAGGCLHFDDLVSVIRDPYQDHADVVASLIVRGVLCVDLDCDLSPETIVWAPNRVTKDTATPQRSCTDQPASGGRGSKSLEMAS